MIRRVDLAGAVLPRGFAPPARPREVQITAWLPDTDQGDLVLDCGPHFGQVHLPAAAMRRLCAAWLADDPAWAVPARRQGPPMGL